MVTWKWAIAPSSTCPRMPVTSIQSRPRRVAFARSTPARIASVTPSGEVPASSTILYVSFSAMEEACPVRGRRNLDRVEALQQRQQHRVRRVARGGRRGLDREAGDDDAAV